MEVHALTRFARMSPQKVREVARQIQGLPAEEAVQLLRFIPRKSARLLSKTLASAIATGLGQGLPLVESIGRARQFVRAALIAAPGLGGGHGPMGHQAVRDLPQC